MPSIINRKLLLSAVVGLVLSLLLIACSSDDDADDAAAPAPAPAPAPAAVAKPSVPSSCVSVGDVITDCPLRSPHVWTPAEQQVPGKVHVFQDYDGPMPTQFFESPYSASLVKQGKLPPVSERLPVASDVSVIAGPDGIGCLLYTSDAADE